MKDRYLNVDDPRDPAPAGEPPPAEAPAPESETDRCLRAVREVLLGQPVPHSLEAAYAEVERRLRGGEAPAS
jgi:hypothetical protein